MKAGPKRIGTLEKNKDANGRVYYRGKIRLDDGSRVGIEIPEAKRYAEKAARNYVAYEQEQENTHHTLAKAKREGQAKRGPRAQKPDENERSYIRYLTERCRRLEERLAQRGLSDEDEPASSTPPRIVL